MRSITVTILSTIFIPFLGILAGIFFGLVDTRYINSVIILVSIIAISVATIISLLTYNLIKLFSMDTEVNKVNLLFNRISNFVIEKDDYPSISNVEELIKLEKSAKEIWVITPDFYWDFEDKLYSTIVKNNIISGKKYWYIFPTEKIGLANEFKSTLEKKISKNIKLIPVAYNFLLFSNEIVIYDPEDPKSNSHCGFITNLSERGEKSLDIKIKMKTSLPFYIDMFKEIINNNCEK